MIKRATEKQYDWATKWSIEGNFIISSKLKKNLSFTDNFLIIEISINFKYNSFWKVHAAHSTYASESDTDGKVALKALGGRPNFDGLLLGLWDPVCVCVCVCVCERERQSMCQCQYQCQCVRVYLEINKIWK